MNWIQAAAWSGLAAVALGAFGAHGLEKVATPEQLEWWATASHYHLTHSLAMLGFGLLQARQGARRGSWAGWGFALGCVVFSGTLYAMALGAPRWFGAITPIGGVALMLGWLGLARAAARAGRQEGSV